MCSSQDITEGFFQLEPNLFLYLPSKQACLHSHIQLRYQNWVCKKTCPADALRNADNQIIENSYGQNTRYFKKKKKEEGGSSRASAQGCRHLQKHTFLTLHPSVK